MAIQAAKTAPAPVGMGSIVANWGPPPFEAPGGSATATRRAASDAPPDAAPDHERTSRGASRPWPTHAAAARFAALGHGVSGCLPDLLDGAADERSCPRSSVSSGASIGQGVHRKLTSRDRKNALLALISTENFIS